MTLIRKKIHLLGLLLLLHSSYSLSMDANIEEDNSTEEQISLDHDSDKEVDSNDDTGNDNKEGFNKSNPKKTPALKKKKVNIEKQTEELLEKFLKKMNNRLDKQNDRIAKLSIEQQSDKQQLNGKITDVQADIHRINETLCLDAGSVTKVDHTAAPSLLYVQDATYVKLPFNTELKKLEYRLSHKYQGNAPQYLPFSSIKDWKWTQTVKRNGIIAMKNSFKANKNRYEFFLKACNYTYRAIGLVTITGLSFAYKNSLLDTASIPKDTKCLVTAGVVGTTFLGSFVASQFYFPKKINSLKLKIKNSKEMLQKEYNKSPEL